MLALLLLQEIAERIDVGAEPLRQFAANRARLGRRRISPANFIQNKLGNVQVETAAMTIPPLSRDLLMREADHVTARTRCQIADDVAIEVCSTHSFNLPHYSPSAILRAINPYPSPLGWNPSIARRLRWVKRSAV